MENTIARSKTIYKVNAFYYIIKLYIQNRSWILDKRSDLVHWENLEGAGGEGGGRGDRDGEHM